MTPHLPAAAGQKETAEQRAARLEAEAQARMAAAGQKEEEAACKRTEVSTVDAGGQVGCECTVCRLVGNARGMQHRSDGGEPACEPTKTDVA